MKPPPSPSSSLALSLSVSLSLFCVCVCVCVFGFGLCMSSLNMIRRFLRRFVFLSLPRDGKYGWMDGWMDGIRLMDECCDLEIDFKDREAK